MYIPIQIVGMGTGTMNGTSDVSVSDAKVLSTDKIMIIAKGILTVTSIGAITVKSISAGSFIVYSSNVLDLRAFDYFIVRQN